VSVPAARGPLIAFDLGGVLVRICADWVQGCHAAGVRPRGEPAIRDQAQVRSLVAAHQRGELEHAAFLEGMSRCLGGSLDPVEVGRVHDAWILGEYQGVSACLRQLRSVGLVTACLSNTNAVHWRQLHGMDFFAGLDHRHASHELGLEKPDPRIYRAFEQRTGWSGQDIIYFDDLHENVEAAIRAGWRAHRIEPASETVPQIRSHLYAWGIRA